MGNVFRGYTHVDPVEGVFQPIVDESVDETKIAEKGQPIGVAATAASSEAAAGRGDMGAARHRFLTAGHGQPALGSQRLGALAHRLHARGTEHIETPGGHCVGETWRERERVSEG